MGMDLICLATKPSGLTCVSVTQGLSGAASALIQLGALVLHYYQKWYAGRTPRQAYKATFVMPSADFGVIHFGWRWTWLTSRAGCPTADISPGHYRTRLLRDQPCHQRLGRCELLPVLFVMEVL
jgi:hypothetical protein